MIKVLQNKKKTVENKEWKITFGLCMFLNTTPESRVNCKIKLLSSIKITKTYHFTCYMNTLKDRNDKHEERRKKRREKKQ